MKNKIFNRKESFISGALQFQGQYKNGLLHGTCEWFFETGNFDAIRTFANGFEKGLQEWFHPNGEIKKEEFYF